METKKIKAATDAETSRPKTFDITSSAEEAIRRYRIAHEDFSADYKVLNKLIIAGANALGEKLRADANS